MHVSSILLLVAGAWQAASPEVLLSEKVMQRTKQAVVFVRIDLDNGTVLSGSGFLARRFGRSGYVVTNDHVIAQAASRQLDIKVAIHSGTSKEKMFPATIVARDQGTDLAILKVEGASLPTPLAGLRLPPLSETTPVFVFGFPFGRGFSTSDKNPAVTIAPAVVSSIRLDEDGEPVIVQIQGDLNPGNSGGPVIDANGNLVGVAVAKLTGTLIGFCVAPGRLNDLFLGGANSLKMEVVGSGPDYIKLRAEVGLSNPMDTISLVSLLVLPTSKGSTRSETSKQSRRSPMSKEMVEASLTVKGVEASGDVVLKTKAGGETTYWVQVKCVRKNKTYTYTEPREIDLKSAKAVIVQDVPPVEKTGTEKALQTKPADVPATDDWLGPRPGTTATLVEETRDVLGAKVVDLAIERSHAYEKPTMYAGDGRSFYHVSYGDRTRLCTLRKISLVDFREEAQTILEKADPGRVCMSRCSRGILVQISDELVILNPDTLKVTKRLKVPGCVRFATAPSLNTALCYAGSVMVAVDLSKGTSVNIKADDLRPPARSRAGSDPLKSFNHSFAISPDGRYLLMTSKGLHRFRIQGKELVYEDIGPPIVQDSGEIVFTSDSKHIITRVYPSSGQPQTIRPGNYMINLYDLSQKPVSLPDGPLCVIDPVTGWMYQGSGSGFILWSPQGIPQREYSLIKVGDCGSRVGAIQVHPSGGKVLVMGNTGCCWVELPALTALLPAAAAAPKPTTNTEEGSTNTFERKGVLFLSRALKQPIRDGFVLSRKGDSVFLLTQDQTLRQVSLPDLKTQRRLDIGHEASRLCLCRDGLLVAVEGLQELWLVGENDLSVQKRIPWCRGMVLVPGSPELPLAFGTGSFGASVGRLMIVDLDSPQDPTVIEPGDVSLASGPGQPISVNLKDRPLFANLAVSPDGRFVICVDEGYLFRLSNKGTALECEEVTASEQITRQSQISFSPDSKYFSVGSLIYRASDLKMPIIRLPEGCALPAFDPESGSLYCLDHIRGNLCVLGREGQIERQYAVSTMRRLLLHPERRTLVLIGYDSLTTASADLGATAK